MAPLPHAPRSASPDLTLSLISEELELNVSSNAQREMLRAAIARLGGHCDWTVDHTGWVVTLYFPEELTFSGGTLDEGLTSCLTWLMVLKPMEELAYV